MHGFLDGYKTYAAGLLSIIAGLWGLVSGQMEPSAAYPMISVGAVALGLRRALNE